MKHPALYLFSALCLLLSGCASTVRSNVTAFNEWPSDLADRSYVFERTKAQDQNLEYRSYENLLRGEMRRLGLVEAEPAKKPALKVTFDFNVQVTDVRTIEPVYADPFFYGPGFFGGGFYGRRYYGTFYDPFFWGAPQMQYQDRTVQLNQRSLHVLISRYGDGKSLYDVKVNSRGENPSMATVMPYMVRSAFAEFPGRNGVTHTVDLKMQN